MLNFLSSNYIKMKNELKQKSEKQNTKHKKIQLKINLI